MYKLYKLISKDIAKKYICVVISVLVVINIFSLELFVYIEKGIMMFSVLLSILAVEQVDKFLEKKKWKNMIVAIVYILIATCSYQGTIGIFVAISLIYIIKYSKTLKEFVQNNINVALIYGIPAVINFALVRFTNYNSRVAGNIVLSESIQKVIQGVKTLVISTYNLFPKCLFLLTFLAIVLFGIYKLTKNKEEKLKTKLIKIFEMLYILLGTLFATIAPQMLQNTESIWFVARSSYPMASVVGILLIYIFNNFDEKRIEENIIIGLASVYMVVQLMFFYTFAIDGYIVNYEDKITAIKIINMIQDYEEQTGNTITKIAIYQDKYMTYTYPEIKTSGDINVSAFTTEWATNAIISYYSGRKLELVEADEQLQSYFKENDWKEFESKQVLFEKEVLHLCLH